MWLITMVIVSPKSPKNRVVRDLFVPNGHDFMAEINGGPILSNHISVRPEKMILHRF